MLLPTGLLRAPTHAFLRATALLCVPLLLASACDKADRNEHLRPYGGSGGGLGGSGGVMDASFDACDCSDDDSGASGTGASGGTGGSGGMDAAVPTFSTSGLLSAAGQCAVARYSEFAMFAGLLAQATSAYAASPTAPLRTDAQAAFRDAMAAWQRAELFRVGPAAKAAQPGGQNLRDQIYFFPIVNRCLIDQQLVSQRYASGNYASTQASSRGLSTVEYLLFHDGDQNACGPSVSINTNGSWSALSSTELAQRRADYADEAVSNILMHAQALQAAWDPSGGNFLATFTQTGNSVFADDHSALTALLEAALYLDAEVKDSKLAVPLSLPVDGVVECPNQPATCPERLESRFARISADNIAQNLIAFRQIFEGCGPGNAGLGVDDWLRSVGEGELADRLLAALDNADAAVAAVGSLESAIHEASPTRALALHAAIKAITDLLKTEIPMVLNVQFITTGGGDVD